MVFNILRVLVWRWCGEVHGLILQLRINLQLNSGLVLLKKLQRQNDKYDCFHFLPQACVMCGTWWETGNNLQEHRSKCHSLTTNT